MKTFTTDELKTVLAQHKLWLDSDYGQGCRAYLSGADLRCANLSGANLSGADLSGADLRCANLSGANLSGADLRDANLRGANLSGANLSGADLRGANLSGAYLRGANLSGANLSGADLRGANLRGADLRDAYLSYANLRGANLRDAYLRGANLSGANLETTKLSSYAHCPEEGEFIAFKKLVGGVIAKLRIPADAGRTSSLVGRKCRAEYAEVLELSGEWGGGPVASAHDSRTLYSPGETVRPDSYDPDIRVECTNGIHFFISRREAEEY